MKKGQNKTGINSSEQDSELVTIPRSEYEELKQDRKEAIRYSGMWRRKYEAEKAIAETLKNALDVIKAIHSELGNEPKNCKPYTGPKVVQMFPKSK